MWMSETRARILVVDDEPSACEALEMILWKGGYEVVSVSNAVGAMNAFRSKDFRLAIVDQMMPGSKGCELVSCLRGYVPGFPVIMISGLPIKELAETDHYLQKPIGPGDLLPLVDRLVTTSLVHSLPEAG